MKTLCFFVAAILLSSASIAQKNFQQGFVVTVNGDTVKGQINNLLWQESPKYITFVGPNGQVQYKPEQLLAFSAGAHSLYRSYKVRVDTTGGSGGDRPENPGPTFREGQLFLKVILDSHYSLLKGRQGFRTHFFIHEKGRVPEELISHSSQRVIGGQLLIQPGNQFVIQLQDKMNDCPKVEIKTDMKYLESSFIDLFEKYNECKNSKTFVPGDESKRRYIGIVAAGHFDQFGNDYKGSMGYTGGIFYEVAFARNVYKTSWYNELVYFKYGAQATGSVISQFTGLAEKYRFEYPTVKLTSLVKAQFLYSKTRPYILGGVGKSLWSGDPKLTVNGQEKAAQIKRGFDGILGFGVYVTDALSAELRIQQSISILYSGAFARTGSAIAGGGAGGATSIGLSLAYHFALGK